MAGAPGGRWTGGDGARPGGSTIDDVPEPVHTLMVQFSTYVRLFFGLSSDRKVRGALRCKPSTGSRCRGTHDMGELISLAERRAARAEARRAARATARELLLRPRVAVDVPRRGAGRPALRRRALGAGHRRRAAGRPRTPRRSARRSRSAPRAADAARLARVAGRGRAQRHARRRAGGRARPRGGVRAGRQSPGLLRRLRPRRSRDPGRGGRRRGPRARRMPARRRRAAPRRRLERTALRLLAQGADALPVLVVGRALFCGEHRSPRRPRRPMGGA